MRIAFLIHGMYREFDRVAEILKVQNLTKYDFYMSTWKISKQKYEDSDSYKEFKVTPNMITDYIPNCVYNIKNESLVFKKGTLNSNKMLFHWKNCLKLMEDSNKEYDLVCLIRSDLSFEVLNKNYPPSESITSLDDWNFDKNTLYSNKLIQIRKESTFEKDIVYMADDLFFCGSQKVMKKFIDNLPNPFTKYTWVNHITLGNYLFENDLILNDSHPFHLCHVIRPKLSY